MERQSAVQCRTLKGVLMLQMTACLFADNPSIEVQLVEEGGVAMPQRLEFGDVHLALMALDHDRFRIRLLYPVRGLAVVPNEHRFSRRRAIEVADLADEPLLLLRNEFASRDWFETACRMARIRPRVLLESAAPHMAVALAGAGYGIAVVPSTVVIPPGHVRGIPLLQRGAAVGRWLRVAWQLSGSCPFMPSNSSTSSGGIASEPTPVGSLTGALRRCLDQGANALINVGCRQV